MDNTRYGSDTQQKGSSSSSDLNEDLRNVKDSLTKTAQHAKDKAEDFIKDAQHRTADLQENVIEYVKSNPMKSVGFAILAGFVTAALVRK